MAATQIPYTQASNEADAFQKVKDGVKVDLMSSFGVKAEIQYDESTKKIVAKGKGFELNVSFGASSLSLDLTLGLLLKPLHGKVMSVLEREFKKVV